MLIFCQRTFLIKIHLLHKKFTTQSKRTNDMVIKVIKFFKGFFIIETEKIVDQR